MIAANETESECIVYKFKRILFQQTFLGRTAKILSFTPEHQNKGFFLFLGWA